MKQDIIRDYYGRIVGYIETDTEGNKTVRDYYKRILGYYDKKADVTRNFYKQILARGDVTGSLIKYD